MSRKAARPDANHPAGRHLPRVARARQKGRRAFAITHRYVEIPPIRSGSGGQTLAGSSCCIRQATRHRGHLRVIARANVHPFGHDVTGGAPPAGSASGGGSGHDSKDRGSVYHHDRGKVSRRIGLRPGPKWWGFAPRGRGGMAPDGDGSPAPGGYRTGMRAWRMRPMRTAARTSGSPGHPGGATRSVNVTGPSLVRVTCIRAPNRPVSTSGATSAPDPRRDRTGVCRAPAARRWRDSAAHPCGYRREA